MLNFITKTIIRSITMAKRAKAVGTKFFTEGTQNQQILQKYWGTGKTFTMDDLRDDLDIASPGARLTELREAGFNVVGKPVETDMPGRPALKYTIAKRRAYSI
jgi:predicted ArsR family transcriptional regulator